MNADMLRRALLVPPPDGSAKKWAEGWHREREAGAGEGDTGERVRRRVASMGEWDRRMIYR